MECTCRPFRIRFDSILSKSLAPFCTFKIANTCQFYSDLLKKAMHVRTEQLPSTFNFLLFFERTTFDTYKLYFKQLTEFADQISELMSKNMLSHSFLADISATIYQIVMRHESCLTAPLCFSNNSFNKPLNFADSLKSSLTIIVQPFLHGCNSIMQKNGADTEALIVKNNCLTTITAALDKHCESSALADPFFESIYRESKETMHTLCETVVRCLSMFCFYTLDI